MELKFIFVIKLLNTFSFFFFLLFPNTACKILQEKNTQSEVSADKIAKL